MKKIFSLLVICLLLTSCNKKESETQTNNEQKQETATNTAKFVRKEDDTISVYTFDDDIKYNDKNLKDALINEEIKIDDVVSSTQYVMPENSESAIFIIETDPAFYVMYCKTQNNNNIYIGNEFEKVSKACD